MAYLKTSDTAHRMRIIAPYMKAITTHLVCAAVWLLSFNLLAQENAVQRHEMATNQLKRITAEMSARCLSDIHTLDYWKRQRPQLRRQMLEMLCLDPLPKRTP